MSAPPFRLEYSPGEVRVHPPRTAFLVTNHLNLMYMLAAGLLMPPAGFAGKHYRDPLASFPGWIPLFIERIPTAAIQLATEEARHLRPVIAEVSLSDLSGPMYTTDAGPVGMRDFQFPDQFEGRSGVLLVPAPLPVSLVVSIVFPSEEHRSAFKRDARDFSNVTIGNLRLEIKRKHLFNRVSAEPWPPASGPEDRELPQATVQAAGGVIAMLQHVANRGQLAVRACAQAFDPAEPSAIPARHFVLAGLSSWLWTGEILPPTQADSPLASESLDGDFDARLFWGVVERLIESRGDPDEGSAEGGLAGYLRETAGDAHLTSSSRKRLQKLLSTLDSMTGLGVGAASDAFQRHRSPVERAMILFCLRRTCAELLEFNTSKLSESDWVAAAILFGARDRWLGLDAKLREIPGLSASISHRLAQMAHRVARTDLKFGAPPARVLPIRELLNPDSQWTIGSRRHAAALILSRAMKWDCIGTRLSLPLDEYGLDADGDAVRVDLPAKCKVRKRGRSVHLRLPSDVEVAPIVDRERFLELLAETRVDLSVEATVRKVLNRRPTSDSNGRIPV